MESLAAAGGERLKMKGRRWSLIRVSSLMCPSAWRQISLPSMAGVVNHSCFRAASALEGSLRMAAR
jgi:hypothetical protein